MKSGRGLVVEKSVKGGSRVNLNDSGRSKVPRVYFPHPGRLPCICSCALQEKGQYTWGQADLPSAFCPLVSTLMKGQYMHLCVCVLRVTKALLLSLRKTGETLTGHGQHCTEETAFILAHTVLVDREDLGAPSC